MQGNNTELELLKRAVEKLIEETYEILQSDDMINVDRELGKADGLELVSDMIDCLMFKRVEQTTEAIDG